MRTNVRQGQGVSGWGKGQGQDQGQVSRETWMRTQIRQSSIQVTVNQNQLHSYPQVLMIIPRYLENEGLHWFVWHQRKKIQDQQQLQLLTQTQIMKI